MTWETFLEKKKIANSTNWSNNDFPIFSNQSHNKLNFICLFSLVTNKWTISPWDFYFYNIDTKWYLDTDCGLDIEET